MGRAKRQADHRHRPEMAIAVENSGILQRQRAAMFLDDLLDDGQAQPGALTAGRHIGFKQPCAVLGQAYAIVGNGDFAIFPTRLHRHMNLRGEPVRSAFFLQAFNGFPGVLDQIGEGLRNHRRVNIGNHRGWRNVGGNAHIRLAGLLQQHRVTHQPGQILVPAVRFRHPGKTREFIDDAAQIIGLADDHIGHRLQLVRSLAQLWRELAFDPLGAQLDRGQRILDLVGDAARHVTPGGQPLGADQVSHIVKRHHIAFKPPGLAAPGRHAHQQVFQPPLTRHLDLALGNLGAVLPEFLEQRAEFRHHQRQRQRFLFPRPVQQPPGRAVNEGHPPLRVAPDHPRGDRRQHRIEQTPAPVDLGGIVQQGLALPLELAGHLVEIAPQHGNLVIAIILDDLHIQITATNPLGRRGQPPHRAR